MTHTAPHRARRGFTLIEVLAATAVLVILLLAMLRIFNDANDLYVKGNRTVLRNNSARAVMDIIARDLEGAIINKHFAAQQFANTFSNDYDSLYFITTTGDPGDGRCLQLVKYSCMVTNINGYNTYRLKRYSMDYDTAIRNGVDPFSDDAVDKEWWNRFDAPALAGPRAEEDLIDNVVRFDLYTHDQAGNIIGKYLGTQNGQDYYRWNSNRNDGYPADTPFGFIDVYLQVTSEDSMKQAHFLRSGGGAAGDRNARRLMDQDSNVLIRRIIPLLGASEIAQPTWFAF